MRFRRYVTYQCACGIADVVKQEPCADPSLVCDMSLLFVLIGELGYFLHVPSSCCVGALCRTDARLFFCTIRDRTSVKNVSGRFVSARLSRALRTCCAVTETRIGSLRSSASTGARGTTSTRLSVCSPGPLPRHPFPSTQMWWRRQSILPLLACQRRRSFFETKCCWRSLGVSVQHPTIGFFWNTT